MIFFHAFHSGRGVDIVVWRGVVVVVVVVGRLPRCDAEVWERCAVVVLLLLVQVWSSFW